MNIPSIIRQLKEGNCVAILWSTEDVQTVRPDLDSSQAMEVLLACVQNHDAELGLNWDAFTAQADQLFPLPLEEEA